MPKRPFAGPAGTLSARAVRIAAAALLVSFTAPASPFAAEYLRDGHLIGTPTARAVEEGESLLEIARQYDLGYGEITAANPGIDPILPDPGSRVVIPTRWILPDAPIRRGIVVNLAEMRLFVFPREGSKTVETFPIGIGDEGTDTPLGTFTVTEKIRNPAWHVPETIREERPDLPAVVPPGPENPLGSHALRLSGGPILIHGTNRPWGVGRRVSHGCIRLYPEDIPRLFGLVRRGTPVAIVNRPVKAAAAGSRVYLEVHDSGDGEYLYDVSWAVLEEKRLADRADAGKVLKASRRRSGLPVNVTGRETTRD
jgi:L,D-transpeptidase ErfK/SrfK